MAPSPNIQRQIGQSANNLYVNRWFSGEVTQKSPLFTPLSQMGLQVIERHDTLKTGADMEISPSMTLVRRYGFSKFCTTAFGSSDWPLAFHSFKNTSGTLKLLVDTPTEVASFTTSAITQLYAKGTTTQSSMQKVGSTIYICDGTNLKKWDQTTVNTWGITAPVTAATVAFDGAAGSVTWTSGTTYVYAFKNSTSGHYSTASPISGNLLAGTNKKIDLTGSRSTQTQVDQIAIFRTLDGGGPYFLVATIANPISGSWSYTDNNLDATLNTDIIAALAHSNDAPPAGLSLVTWHQDRLWGALNNLLYFSAGPDSTLGVPEECWPPANVMKLPGTITGMVSTSQGLLIFTSSDMYVALGQSTADFWVRAVQKNFGIASQNCITQDGDSIYVYTSHSQLWELNPAANPPMNEIGFAIGDQLLSTFPPASSYLAMHRSGSDVGLFISNGSTKVKMYNVNFNSWAPTATPVGGVTAIGSIETATATYSLMLGRAAGSGYMLKRDTTLYTDDGTAYTCSATVGSIIVAPAGETAEVDTVIVEAMPVGTFPTIGVLVNEISGTYATLALAGNDPPKYDGTPYASTTIWSKRHYFKGASSPVPERIRHMLLQVSFLAENVRSELLGLAVQKTVQL